MAYWHSDCPACEQGRLFVEKTLDTGELFLLCEECEYAWRTPDEINLNTHFDFQNRKIESATREDIERHGWLRYSLTQA